ncbi:hypothetical protein FRC11_003829, partial [Ceratobasidium sp. 423]
AILKEEQRCFEQPMEFYQGQEAQLHEAQGDIANFWPGMDMEGSLFSMQFEVTAPDEIHNFQNCGVTNRGVQCLTENSQLVIGATATLLFTTFFASLQEAQQEAKEGRLSTEDAQFSDLVDQAKHKYGSEDQVSILKGACITQGTIDLLRGVTCPVIIHCTGESQDYQGDQVLQKTPMWTIIAYSPMSRKKCDGLAAVNEQHQEQRKAQEVNKLNKKVKKLDSAKIKWKNFLWDQSSACVYVGDSWNESNIHEKASTQMLKVDQIIEHYWTGNLKPLLFKEDGTTIPSVPGHDPLPCDDLLKFLIYVGFINHRNLFSMMFDEIK